MSIIGRVMAGVIRLALYPFQALWLSLSPRGRFVAGLLLAGSIAAQLLFVHAGPTALAGAALVSLAVGWWHRRRLARRGLPSGGAVKATLDREALLAATWLAEVCHPDTLVRMSEQVKLTPWKREGAAIMAAVEELAHSDTDNHRTYASAVRLAKTRANVWQPEWLVNGVEADAARVREVVSNVADFGAARQRRARRELEVAAAGAEG